MQMIKDTDIAWSAGFFDGEGWLVIQKRGGKYKSHYLRIGIAHVAPEPLYEMQRLYGGNIRKDSKVYGNRKPRHVWTLSCSKAANAVMQMQPYLHNKNEVCRLGLEFQKTMLEKGAKVPEEVVILRENYKQSIKKANGRD